MMITGQNDGTGGGKKGLVIGLIAAVVALAAVAVVLLVLVLKPAPVEEADAGRTRRTRTASSKASTQDEPDITDTSDMSDTSNVELSADKPPKRADVDYDTGTDGFALTDPESFAARAEGVYRLVADNSEEGFEERLEIFRVGNNLYGCYSGYGFYAIELFATHSDGFSVTDTNEREIQALGFSIQSNLGDYFSPTPAGYTMRITDNGLTFTDYDGKGENLLGGATYERVDELPGDAVTGGFSYRRSMYTDFASITGTRIIETPEALYGTRVTLGDLSDAIYMELTPEGLAQVYQKIANTEVTLMRGSYAVAAGDGEDDYRIFLFLQSLGYTSSEELYEVYGTLEPDGTFLIQDGDTVAGGMQLFTYYNTLITTTPDRIPVPEPFTESCGRITPVRLTREESAEEIQSYLSGSWTLYRRGNPTRITPFLVMDFVPMYQRVTIRRPDDDAVCYGTYTVEQAEFDGTWLALLRLSLTDLPAEFSGSLYGFRTEAAGDYVCFLGESDSGDLLYLLEAGNGGTSGVTDAIFQPYNGIDEEARFVFGRERGDWRTDYSEREEEEARYRENNAVFYGFVWNDSGNTVDVQHVDIRRFSFDFYDQQITVLCPMAREYRGCVTYEVAGMEEMAHQGSYACKLYRMETDAGGVIISMEAVEPYGGDLAGLYHAD